MKFLAAVAAADRLAVTRLAVTRAVAWLEAGLGGSLFERQPTGVRMSALGALGAEQAGAVLRSHEAAEVGRRRAGGRRGCIRATAEPPCMEAVALHPARLHAPRAWIRPAKAFFFRSGCC